jgi:hypothetical protein
VIPGVIAVTKYKTLKYGHPYSEKTATRYDTASPTKQPVKGGKSAVLCRSHNRKGNVEGLLDMVARSIRSAWVDEARICWKVESLTGTKEGSGRGAGRLDGDRASVLSSSFTEQAIPLTEIDGL